MKFNRTWIVLAIATASPLASARECSERDLWKQFAAKPEGTDPQQAAATVPCTPKAATEKPKRAASPQAAAREAVDEAMEGGSAAHMERLGAGGKAPAIPAGGCLPDWHVDRLLKAGLCPSPATGVVRATGYGAGPAEAYLSAIARLALERMLVKDGQLTDAVQVAPLGNAKPAKRPATALAIRYRRKNCEITESYVANNLNESKGGFDIEVDPWRPRGEAPHCERKQIVQHLEKSGITIIGHSQANGEAAVVVEFRRR